jgi:hypothetical protein
MTYLSKSNDSFKSRLRFYLFEKTVSSDSDKSPNLAEFLSYDLKEKRDLITAINSSELSFCNSFSE